MNLLEPFGVLPSLLLAHSSVAACLLGFDDGSRSSAQNQPVVRELVAGILSGTLADCPRSTITNIDIQLLEDLRRVVNVPTRQAEALIDNLLASIGFGVRLGH